MQKKKFYITKEGSRN